LYLDMPWGGHHSGSWTTPKLWVQGPKADLMSYHILLLNRKFCPTHNSIRIKRTRASPAVLVREPGKIIVTSNFWLLMGFFFSIQLKLDYKYQTTNSQPTWSNQTIYPIRNREQSINMIWLHVLRLFPGSETRAMFQGESNLPAHPIDFNALPHSRFPLEGRSHSERWWRCSTKSAKALRENL
jgi:hypothetical protein